MGTLWAGSFRNLAKGMEGHGTLRDPRMFLVIHDQDSRDQLNLVPKELEGRRSGQKSGIHEDALPEWDIEWNRSRLTEDQRAQAVASGHGLILEDDLHVRDAKVRLMDDQSGSTSGGIRKCHFPRTFARAPVFDAPIKNGIADHRQHKCQDEMLQRTIRLHVQSQPWGPQPRCQAGTIPAIYYLPITHHLLPLSEQALAFPI